MTFKSRKKIGINRANRFFRTKLKESKAQRVFDTMDLIGVENRAVVLEMSLTLFIEKYGAPLK